MANPRLLVVLFAVLLAGCETTQVISVNESFVSLMLQQAELQERSDTFESLEYELVLSDLRGGFLSNGDRALELAEQASDSGNKASLLNVAARSYLKSGSEGIPRLSSIAEKGRAACVGVVAGNLPVTCGYFELLEPLGIISEQALLIQSVGDAERAARASGGKLTDNEAATGLQAAERSLDQLAVLQGLRQGQAIAWTKVSEGFSDSFSRQEVIAFCNGLSALSYLSTVSAPWQAANQGSLDEVQEQIRTADAQLTQSHGQAPDCSS